MYIVAVEVESASGVFGPLEILKYVLTLNYDGVSRLLLEEGGLGMRLW